MDWTLFKCVYPYKIVSVIKGMGQPEPTGNDPFPNSSKSETEIRRSEGLSGTDFAGGMTTSK